jgi:hypothetical protein
MECVTVCEAEAKSTHTEFSFWNFSARDDLRDFGADETIIVKQILEMDCEDLNWNNLAHNEVQYVHFDETSDSIIVAN